MAAERWSDLLTLLAALTGAAVLAFVWPRPPRARVARLRHPSTPPPIAVELSPEAAPGRWRISIPAGGSTTTLDIFTWQPTGTSLPWTSEPIVDPVVLEPGTSVVLSTVVADPAAPHDVVFAWTVRHPDGDIQGSRTVHVEPGARVPPAEPPASRLERPRTRWMLLAGCVLLGAALGVIALVSASRLLDDEPVEGPDAAIDEPIDDTVSTSPSTAPIEPSTERTTSPPSTDRSITASSAAATDAPPSTDESRNDTSSTTASTTTATTPSTTASVTTTTVVTVTDPDGRFLSVAGRVGECRYGSECLIVDFSLVGFAAEGEYVCEFGDGSRFVFRYVGDDAADACATSGDSITVEVDGVRAAAVTRTPTG